MVKDFRKLYKYRVVSVSFSVGNRVVLLYYEKDNINTVSFL